MILFTEPIGSCSSGFSPFRYNPVSASMSAQDCTATSGTCVPGSSPAAAPSGGGPEAPASGAPGGAPSCALAGAKPALPSASRNAIKTSTTATFTCLSLTRCAPRRIGLFLSFALGYRTRAIPTPARACTPYRPRRLWLIELPHGNACGHGAWYHPSSRLTGAGPARRADSLSSAVGALLRLSTLSSELVSLSDNSFYAR